MHRCIGWDIGGANLKAALLHDGEATAVHQLPCPLWLGLDQLALAIQSMLKQFHLKSGDAKHVATMTGELVDLFANRHDGVVQIANLVNALLGEDVMFYSMQTQNSQQHFVSFDQVENYTQSIASANWHASARLVAELQPTSLLIDIGSTTTDIIPILNGQLMSEAVTDAARMQNDTLVYSGVMRTPVMAIAQKLSVDDIETNVAAEYFATMADVYRLTGELTDGNDMTNTADGQEKTILASARRLARMVGCDVEDKPIASWQQLAFVCREKQLAQIGAAAQKHLSEDMVIVGAGAGAFLVKALADKLDFPYANMMSLVHHADHDNLEVCLPAYAVAKLASTEGGGV